MGAALKNFTPFPNMQFANWDAQGREFGVFMVKTAWDIQPDGTCTLSEEQEPFALTDEFHGELNASSVRYPSDLVPYKPTTDFILNATTFAPQGKASEAWECSIEVTAHGAEAPLVEKKLLITGPRHWTFRKKKWELSRAEPIKRLNVQYDHAYGGSIKTGEDENGDAIVEAYEYNPVGKGFADPDWTHKDQPVLAPQILLPEQSLCDPFEQLKPAGFGPIQASWLPRRPLGGTYDEHWSENVWPNWPEDYQFWFHNAAPEGQRHALPPGEGARCTLKNLHPEREEWIIDVPNPRLAALVQQGSELVIYGLHIDTVFLDIAHDRLDDPRVFLMSRMVFDRELTQSITLTRLSSQDVMSDLKLPPTPNQIARFIPDGEGIEEEVSV